MIKQYIMTSMAILLTSYTSWGQFTAVPGTGNIINSNVRNVGIGNPTPLGKLDVKSVIWDNPYLDSQGNSICGTTTLKLEGFKIQGGGCIPESSTGNEIHGYLFEGFINENNTLLTRRILFDDEGRVGIGNNIYPQEDLDVEGSIVMRAGAQAGYIPVATSSGKMVWTAPSAFSGSSHWVANGNDIQNVNTGVITIGGMDKKPGYLLNVSGKIACEEVKVELKGDWQDVVFEPGYSLMSIGELEKYIDENGHLPHIAEGSILEEDGIDLSQMASDQMRTIEELALYIIQLEKRISSLEGN